MIIQRLALIDLKYLKEYTLKFYSLGIKLIIALQYHSNAKAKDHLNIRLT